jgi:hypothetical protein
MVTTLTESKARLRMNTLFPVPTEKSLTTPPAWCSTWSSWGSGTGANPLLDMRIHDITVVADPNRRLPAAPEQVEADGTINGLVSDPDH